MATQPIKKVCKQCHQDFETRDDRKKYCSKTCFGLSQRKGYTLVCEQCKKEFYLAKAFVKRANRGKAGRFCSRVCKSAWQKENLNGVNNPNWKGGSFIRSDGYVAVNIGKGNYRLEHDLIVETTLGRTLEPHEEVHHKNEVRHDNRSENLELTNNSKHISEHHPCQRQEDKWVISLCLYCNKAFERRAYEAKRHPQTFCSRSCYVLSRQSGLM
jgi:hypothetical protein